MARHTPHTATPCFRHYVPCHFPDATTIFYAISIRYFIISLMLVLLPLFRCRLFSRRHFAFAMPMLIRRRVSSLPRFIAAGFALPAAISAFANTLFDARYADAGFLLRPRCCLLRYAILIIFNIFAHADDRSAAAVMLLSRCCCRFFCAPRAAASVLPLRLLFFAAAR